MPKLRVSVGPDRFHQIIARVNDIGKPTEIDTPLFAGRVLVYVKDFCGVTPDGTPPVTDCSYFDGRSRKFGILIEGRFKAREGIEPYTGDEVQFGSDFDFLPPSFPRGPFKVGMKIARMVDPATSFEENPPNGRPYIMSPYLGAMNTICAYPSPAALPRAVLIAHHDAAHPHEAGEARLGGFVPIEELEGSKRVQKNPWRFLGDSTFAFVDPEHPRSVAQRRKHFVVDSGKNRKDFVYDPEIVYTTSFFTNWYDLNSLQLKMGPVNLDISDFFDAMPIRYALRSTRLAPKPDVTPGPMEEETFCTIAFDLVDD
ncbi:hypothetical protein RQP46_005637 [Phenoliferia psychrophenolica]